MAWTESAKSGLTIKNPNHRGGEGERVRRLCKNQYTFKTQLHMTKRIISNKFIIVCMNVQLFVHVVHGIHVSIAYWVVGIGGREARFLQAHGSISQGRSKTGLIPSQPSMWSTLCSWRWGSRCSWKGCCPPWGCCHGYATNHPDTLSRWGVGPEIWVSKPSSIGWRWSSSTS